MTSTQPRRPLPRQAAALIKLALERRNGQTAAQLAAMLGRRNIPAWYVPRGIRLIRDAYGENCLVKERDGRTITYVLDPHLSVARADFTERSKRIRTESRHILSDLDWFARQGANSGIVRRARRLARGLVAEIADLEDEFAAG